jgi:hypothetical protein
LRWLGDQWWNAKDISKSDRYFNHFQTASEWADVFGIKNVKLVNYHKGDAVYQFFRMIGVELPRTETPRDNVSLALEKCTLLYMINRLFGTPDFNNFGLIQRRHAFTHALLEYIDNLAIEGTPLLSSLSNSDLEHMKEDSFNQISC